MKKLILVLLMFIIGCSSNYKKTSVMITNLNKSSGGSGVIIETNNSSSFILTNGHVCNVVKHGGYVIDDDHNAHMIESYKLSTLHDLCVIKVAEDLHYSAKLADKEPVRYEDATIVGHPRLLPTTVTRGEFTDKRVIPVIMGLRDCTKEDIDNPDTSIFCLLIGKVPLIKIFESVAVTALIQPGSSGSPIYDSNGHIGALVFAGSGDIGFAFAVPYGYVSQFLKEELSTLEVQLPKIDNQSEEEQEEKSTVAAYVELCKTIPEGSDQKKVCKTIEHYYGRKNVI